MPIYEYECQKCGKKFEYFDWLGGIEKILKCPKCGAQEPKRVVSSFSKGTAAESCAPKSHG
jgi:putative FmdB family regulatory protein